jgi:hypothetical protein
MEVNADQSKFISSLTGSRFNLKNVCYRSVENVLLCSLQSVSIKITRKELGGCLSFLNSHLTLREDHRLSAAKKAT